MTPAQLRAFSAVVRLGSVHRAATEFGMSDAGVSMHIAQLRKELHDPLFTRTATGLSFTPGGLRLASRATTLPAAARQPVVTELLNFITTPRCTQAMIKGSGVPVDRFRPKIHVTLWS